MRPAFVEELTRLAAVDKNVYLVTADLGFCVFEEFRDRFPNQFLNVGVAEQNLMSVSAGLAMSGKKVFAYSISTFASMRAYEQVRNDICYQNLSVFIVGGGSAFSYSTFGCTHFALEDLGIMRIFPNMAVMAPGDPIEVRALVRQAYERNGPAYIRIAKRGEPLVHTLNAPIQLGKATTVVGGDDVAIFVCGGQLPNALKAAASLSESGIKCRLLSFHTIKPLDHQAIVAAAKETKGIITVEEHFITGGFGSAIAESLVDNGLYVPLVRLGISDEFPNKVGNQDYFLQRYRLTSTGIAHAARELLNLT